MFGVCQSATLLTRQASPWGKESEDISQGELEAALKVSTSCQSDISLLNISEAEYAGDILFIAALCFAKVSVCASVLSLSLDEWHRRSSYALAAVVFSWATSSILGVAFQCGIHGSWVSDTSQCFHRVGSQLNQPWRKNADYPSCLSCDTLPPQMQRLMSR